MVEERTIELVRRTSRVQLRDDRTFRMLQPGEIDEGRVDSSDIAEAEVLERAAQMDCLIRIADLIPYIRNHIAHGGDPVGFRQHRDASGHYGGHQPAIRRAHRERGSLDQLTSL